MSMSEPPSSTCQKVQPLHDGAPCKAAPTLWIEPEWPSQTMDPSARPRRSSGRASVSARLGAHAAFDQQAEGDAVALFGHDAHRAFVEGQGRGDVLAGDFT